MAIGKEGNVKWVDGLRGLASSLVVVTHIARAFDEELFWPAKGENGFQRLLQYPYLRVFIQGRIGVAIFSMVTGYVCALKPIKLSRQGNQEAALVSMSKSALRRGPRLIIPTTIATLLIWLMAQFGLFTVAKHSSGWWAASSSPNMFPTIGEAFSNLLHNIVLTWTRNRNEYDPNQWTLLPLLCGSMKVYIFIMATCFLTPWYRMLASLTMWMYYYVASDPFFGMQFFFGVFLSDLQNHPPAMEFVANRPRLSKILSFVLFMTGMYVASCPEKHADWAPWSTSLRDFLAAILPREPNFGRFSTGLGLEFISLGLHFSPWLRDVLSNRYFLWLGKQSFAVYLLHGPLLRTVLCWMLFGFAIPEDKEVKGDDGNMKMVPGKFAQPGSLKLVLCTMVWLPLVYGAAVCWTTWVDPWCARVTERAVKYVKEDETEKPSVLPVR